ncbi:hypothetical protein EYF80_044663 [Liparis tanakae]|uniref:Uncharacterized protein n=1 Tax=Liparis tanakae TaxID=230148 RepID=A0A4Z2FX67_9TELE|nr:hypothetical protein EYF80_044663 [Liparis tanakae]
MQSHPRRSPEEERGPIQEGVELTALNLWSSSTERMFTNMMEWSNALTSRGNQGQRVDLKRKPGATR